MNQNLKSNWWDKGVKFQCQGSGKCCTSHGEFGYVFLTLEDRRRIAAHLKIRTSEFTKKYCQKSGTVWHLIESPGQPDCLFLKNKACSIYESRPTQCRTWPFWPEVMSPKSWAKDVVNFCPGVGKGPLIKKEEIEKILNQQIQSEKEFS